VGAVIVVHNAIIATGYNGTPIGRAQLQRGWLPRCASDAPTGAGYDACICVHAEQNAIVFGPSAAMRRTRACSTRPCALLRLREGGHPGRHSPHRVRRAFAYDANWKRSTPADSRVGIELVERAVR